MDCWEADDVQLKRLVEANSDHREFDGGRVRLCVSQSSETVERDQAG
jgi:hypothetical protein